MTGAAGEPGIASVGPGTTIHRTVEVFGGESVRVGAHTRIDCFAVITAGPGLVDIGAFVHLAAASMIFGTGGVTIGVGVSLSSRVAIYSTTADLTSGHLGGPQLPAELTNVHSAPVVVERHVIIGAGSVILPGVRLGYGSAVGALSLVKDDVEPHTVVGGVPARVLGRRDPAQLARGEEQLAAYQAALARR